MGDPSGLGRGLCSFPRVNPVLNPKGPAHGFVKIRARQAPPQWGRLCFFLKPGEGQEMGAQRLEGVCPRPACRSTHTEPPKHGIPYHWHPSPLTVLDGGSLGFVLGTGGCMFSVFVFLARELPEGSGRLFTIPVAVAILTLCVTQGWLTRRFSTLKGDGLRFHG